MIELCHLEHVIRRPFFAIVSTRSHISSHITHSIGECMNVASHQRWSHDTSCSCHSLPPVRTVLWSEKGRLGRIPPQIVLHIRIQDCQSHLDLILAIFHDRTWYNTQYLDTLSEISLGIRSYSIKTRGNWDHGRLISYFHNTSL